jgi:hypothetical protein
MLGFTLLICPVELVSVSVSSLIYIKLRSCFLFFFKADHRKGKWLVVIGRQYTFLFLWRNSSSGAWATSLLRFLDHTQLETHTPGRTPPNDWSAHRRDRYLRSNKKERQTLMPPSGFKPAIPAIKRLKTCALDRLSIGAGFFFYWDL